MKLARKITAFLLAGLVAIGIFAASAASSFAVSIIFDDSFKYAVISDDTLAVYKYLGNDTSVVLPETYGGRQVIGIYEDCFKKSNIFSVTIPDSYTFIGDGAFYECSNLTSIRLPKNLESIGMMALAKCTAIETVDFSKAEKLKRLPEAVCLEDTALKSISISSVINRIDDNAFANCGLTSVKIPDSITRIGSGAFSGCAELSEVILSSKLNEIRTSTFQGCTKLESVALPESISKIGALAFEGCTSLENIEITGSITEIGEKAFYNDSSLKTLFIPDTVTSIGANAFAPMSYSKKIEITCFEDSYAAKYCYENYVENCITVEKLMGDVNMDGVVDILDVTNIQQYKIGTYDISTYRQKTLSDVNKDGSVTVRDATLIQMYLAHYFDSFDDEIQ